MKKYILLFIGVAALMTSCTQKEDTNFYGSPNVYFKFADYDGKNGIDSQDSVFVHFGYDEIIKADSLFFVGLRVQGEVTHTKRMVDFMLDPEYSTATASDVELVKDSSYVAAGANEGRVAVRLKNTPNLNGKQLYAAILLVANDEFGVDYTTTLGGGGYEEGTVSAIRYKIIFDNFADVPNLWAYDMTYFTNYLGTFSGKKLDIICDQNGLTRDYFTYDPGKDDPDILKSRRFPIAIIRGICRMVNRYLANYLATNGEPLLDEDGTVMELGPSGKQYQ